MMMCYFQKAFMCFFYCLNCSKNTLVDIRFETQDLVVIVTLFCSRKKCRIQGINNVVNVAEYSPISLSNQKKI